MKPKLILIGVGAALVLSIVWFMVLWSPQGKSLDQAKADKVAAEQRASELQVRLTHLKKLEANAAVLEAEKAKLATAIPATDELDKFILAVNDRAAKSGVSFVSVSPVPPAAAGPGASSSAPPAINLQIAVNGDYFQIMSFLEKLRDGERLVTVETFSLSKVGDGNQLTAAIGGRMYVSPKAAAAAATTPSA
ncbi:MAG: hypothetical protein QOF60_1753 [Actinomycetota bacterium]|nr:hypothetical protein [Actinomycetota bacterium]